MERRHPSAARYIVATEFADEEDAGRAYRRVAAALHGAGCDLSAYRLLLDGVPYVVVVGEPPGERLGERLRLALICGHPAELPPAVVATLAARRAERRREGPWVEEHHRPGRRLHTEEER